MSIVTLNSNSSFSPDIDRELEDFRREIKEKTEIANQTIRQPNNNYQNHQNNDNQTKVEIYETLNKSLNISDSRFSLRTSRNSNIMFSEKNYNIISFLKSEEKRTNQQQYFNPEELDFEFTEKTDKVKGLIFDAKV
jgi:hypothetical protein